MLARLSGAVVITRVDGSIAEDHGDAVVFLDGAVAEEAESMGAIQLDISQRGARFTPKVLPLTRGSTVRFMNDDNIFHNVFSLSRAATFDLGIYPEGTHKYVTFADSGLVNVYCNIHPDMVSQILVLNNPWFAKTDTGGDFLISAIPPGEYTLRVWHEHGGEIKKTILLNAGENHVETLRISSSVASLSHRNKFGKPYRDKY
jgi:plastocyanin